MTIERPDLDQASAEIREYIDYLEREIERLKTHRQRISRSSKNQGQGFSTTSFEPIEPATTINIITVSKNNLIKRTPRHLYPRQRRSGMGIFDIETSKEDPPKLLTTADESDILLMITNQGRGFNIPLNRFPDSPVRSRGKLLTERLKLLDQERLIFIGPQKVEDTFALVSERGYIRLLRHNFVNNIRPGTQLMDVHRFGSVTASSWIGDNDEVFIATKMGKAIRFAARRVHPNGSLGIRLERVDYPIAVTGVSDKTSVFLLGNDGKGTVRIMTGFRSNKSPGAGGKIALKTDFLVSAINTTDKDDIFIISKLSKIIRFQSIEIPPKTGTVQGVNCMVLRADQCVAAITSLIA